MEGSAHHLPTTRRPWPASSLGWPSDRPVAMLACLTLPSAALCARTDAEEGGETAFPAGKWMDEKVQAAGQPFSECAKGHVAALPR